MDPAVADLLIDVLNRSEHVRFAARFGPLVPTSSNRPRTDEVAEDDLAAIPPAAFTLTASDQPDRVGLAVDGDPASRWMSGRPQNGTAWIALDFDRPRTVSQIDFAFSERSLQDFPREIEIVAAGPAAGDPERLLYRGTVLAALGRGWLRTRCSRPSRSPCRASPRGDLTVRQRGHTEPWVLVDRRDWSCGSPVGTDCPQTARACD